MFHCDLLNFLVLVLFVGLLVFAGCIGSSTSEKCVSGTVLTTNGKISVCFDEKMTDLCSQEGTIYKQTQDSKIVCSDGNWISQPLSSVVSVNQSPSTDITTPSDCSGTTSTTINGKTTVCLNGKMTDSCTLEGEIYSESEIFQDMVICENGKWIERSTE